MEPVTDPTGIRFKSFKLEGSMHVYEVYRAGQTGWIRFRTGMTDNLPASVQNGHARLPLRTRREAAGLSRPDLSKESRLFITTIEKVEMSHEQKGSPNTRQRLHEALD